MLTGKFDIEFTCKVPKHGFKWGDGLVLLPKRDTGIKEVEFSLEAYDDFRRLAQYRATKTNIETHKAETLRFVNKWGNPFSSKMNFNAGFEFLKAWAMYSNLVRAFQENTLPEDPKQYLAPFNATYGWDSHGNRVVPIFQPSCLWDAIKIVMVFSGVDTKEVSGMCARDGCNEVFSGRTNKKYCSDFCQKKAWEQENSRKTRSQKRSE